MTMERLKDSIALLPHTHIYWCPVGGHWGVTFGTGIACWMGCNFPPWPGTVAHLPEEAQ